MRNHFLLKYVEQHFLEILICKDTYEHALERNHFLVKYVDQHFLEFLFVRSPTNTLERSQFPVKCVDQHFKTAFLLIATFEHTLKQNFFLWKVSDKSNFIQFQSKRSHVYPHRQEIIFCEVCGSTFKDCSYFKHHMQTRTGEIPFSSKFCTSAFPQNSYLKHS